MKKRPAEPGEARDEARLAHLLVWPGSKNCRQTHLDTSFGLLGEGARERKTSKQKQRLRGLKQNETEPF